MTLANPATVADHLHEIADDLAKLGHEIPTPRLSFCVTLSPSEERDATTRAMVDSLAVALTGKPGTTENTSAMGWAHHVRILGGPVDLSIYGCVTPPAEEDPAALKARIADLEAKLAAELGLSFTRGGAE